MAVFIYSIDFNSLEYESFTISNAKGIVFGKNAADAMDKLTKWYEEGTGIEKVILERIDTYDDTDPIEILYNNSLTVTDFMVDLEKL